MLREKLEYSELLVGYGSGVLFKGEGVDIDGKTVPHKPHVCTGKYALGPEMELACIPRFFKIIRRSGMPGVGERLWRSVADDGHG